MCPSHTLDDLAAFLLLFLLALVAPLVNLDPAEAHLPRELVGLLSVPVLVLLKLGLEEIALLHAKPVPTHYWTVFGLLLPGRYLARLSFGPFDTEQVLRIFALFLGNSRRMPDFWLLGIVSWRNGALLLKRGTHNYCIIAGGGRQHFSILSKQLLVGSAAQ